MSASRSADAVKHRTVSEDVLGEIIRRIVDEAHPERIFLFGSAARGEIGPHSDIDLLIVKEGVHRRKLAQRIYERLIGVGVPVDVVVVTPQDIERYGTVNGLILRPALTEGKVVYERSNSATACPTGVA